MGSPVDPFVNNIYNKKYNSNSMKFYEAVLLFFIHLNIVNPLKFKKTIDIMYIDQPRILLNVLFGNIFLTHALRACWYI